MGLSLKFHKDPNLCCRNICKSLPNFKIVNFLCILHIFTVLYLQSFYLWELHKNICIFWNPIIKMSKYKYMSHFISCPISWEINSKFKSVRLDHPVVWWTIFLPSFFLTKFFKTFCITKVFWYKNYFGKKVSCHQFFWTKTFLPTY